MKDLLNKINGQQILDFKLDQIIYKQFESRSPK